MKYTQDKLSHNLRNIPRDYEYMNLKKNESKINESKINESKINEN